MGWPFVWRKTAEAETAVWKARAARQQKRAEKAERIAVREVRNRRSIAEICAALIDERGVFERFPRIEPVQPRPAPQRPGFDETRTRAAADRIAELPRASARARAYVATQTAVKEDTAS